MFVMSNLELVNSIKIVDLNTLRLYLQNRLEVLSDYISETDSSESIELYSAVVEELRILLRKLL